MSKGSCEAAESAERDFANGAEGTVEIAFFEMTSR